MMKKILFLIFITCFLSSCKVFNPTKMLRMGPFPEYSNIDLIKSDQIYRIAPFDKITFSVFPNDGEMLIGIGERNSYFSSGANYEVEYDGTIKLPLFGRIPVEGMTERELEKMIEEKYSLFLNKPFVSTVSVTNKRVFVFKGGKNSSVVPLSYDNMTIWELIAQTGGVGDAKAHKIKLIRQIDDVFHIFLIDLSKLESVKTGNIVLQANDIIYITPRNKISEEIIFALTPYLSLLSTFVLIYSLIK